MPITTRAILDKIEIFANGTVAIRLAKQVLSDNGDVIAEDWHRSVISPGEDYAAKIADASSNLSAIGYGAIDQIDTDKISAAISTFQTSSVIETFKAEQADNAVTSIAQSDTVAGTDAKAIP